MTGPILDPRRAEPPVAGRSARAGLLTCLRRHSSTPVSACATPDLFSAREGDLGGQGTRSTRVSTSMPDKAATIAEYRLHETDTGSPEVQVAMLSERINASHRAPQGPPRRSPHPPRSDEAHRATASPARLRAGERRRALPRAHRAGSAFAATARATSTGRMPAGESRKARSAARQTGATLPSP